MAARESFSPAQRVRRRWEFRTVQSTGAKVHTRNFIVVLRPREDEHRRLGITVTKRVGCAVVRNRIKRVVREVFRRNINRFPTGCDVVVIGKPNRAKGASKKKGVRKPVDYETALKEFLNAEGAMRRALDSWESRDKPTKRSQK